MAEDHVNRQQFLVRDIATSSVTFFPSRANVVRDVKDISIKPGANEIVILGLTPTADENSIKVDGKGSATITDMMVELIPNPDRYEDVYGSDSDDDESDEDSSSDSESEDENLTSLKQREDDIIRQMKVVQEKNNSATAALKILDGYGKTVEKDRPDDLPELLSSYHEQRKKFFEIFHATEHENAKLLQKRLKAGRNVKKAFDRIAKEKRKAAQEEKKKNEAKIRESEKVKKAKREEKANRLQFWPKKVYKITVSLDAISEFTPASSRRGSVTSLDKGYGSNSSETQTITLSLSYITSQASWTPRYDLNLTTPTESGSIMYRAEFKNATSETWKDAKVTLSTSETTFQGLGDPIPTLMPWHLDLSKGSWARADSDPLYSKYEYDFRATHLASGGLFKSEASRETLFGLDDLDQEIQVLLQQKHQRRQFLNQREHNLNNNIHTKPAFEAKPSFQLAMNPVQSYQAPQAQQGFGSSAFGSNAGSGLFGSNSSNTNTGAAAFRNSSRFSARSRAAAPPPPGAVSLERGEALDEASPDFAAVAYDVEGETDTLKPEVPSLDTLESSITESGLTVNYDIPGLRTLQPSFTYRRHRIATIQLKEIKLSHVLVPKLRTAAFLKARIKNTSSYALLRGPTGVTLDGSFLGNMTLPRASAGETLSMSLGVDPGVTVAYSRTKVRKTQTGILNKESSSVFTRTCTVTNTKSNRTIEGHMLDQVPLSNEERLKVEVVEPRGLRKEKDMVRAGTGVTTTGKDEARWGKATATFKRGGEVCFDFKIEGGKVVKFITEYETRHPSTEQVVNAER